MTEQQTQDLILIRDKLEMLGDTMLEQGNTEAHDAIACAFHEIASLVGYPDPDPEDWC